MFYMQDELVRLHQQALLDEAAHRRLAYEARAAQREAAARTDTWTHTHTVRVMRRLEHWPVMTTETRRWRKAA